MEEQRALARFAEALEYIEEGEPLKLPLPDRRVSAYVQSHLGKALPAAEATQLPGPRAGHGQRGPRQGLSQGRLPPSSSVSGRLGEAALPGGAAGVGQTVEPRLT